MYRRQAESLGAVPLIVTGILTMLQYGYSSGQAAAEIGRQYEEFYRMRESEVSALALELGRQTDTAYWEWFNTLRSAQRLGVPQPNGGRVEPPPDTKEAGISTTTMLIAAGVVALLFATRR